MRRLRVTVDFWAVLFVIAGCGGRGTVTFNLTAPSQAMLNPVAAPALVTEYDIRTASGSVIGIASAVQGSGQSANGLLPLGALMPSDTPEDVYVTALSGGTTLGLARIKDVSIEKGKKTTYEADLRKPLVVVGSALPAEGSGNATTAVQVIDPLTELDLAKQPMTPVSLASVTAAASTWDGRFVVVANGSALTAFDTGSGKTVAGTLTLSFAPTRIVVAPRDQAIVALDPGSGGNGSFAIISDVAGFVGSPGSANPNIVRLAGAVARTAAFSPDGTKLYVLTGGTGDPCAPGTTNAANAVQIYGLDGSMSGMLALQGFAADLTVDPQSGAIVIADVAGKQIATIDPSSAAPTPTKVLGNLTCPSAVRVVNGTVFAVTSDRDMTSNAFIVQRIPLAGGAATATLIEAPFFNIPIDSMESQNGDIGMAVVPIRPVTLDAYELAVTPDGGRAEFGTRIVYNEANTEFMFSGEDCHANLTIVEYGLFALDLHTGNAAYESRSQLVTMGAKNCVDCSLPPLPDQVVECQSTAGDRPAGLAATFGQ